jgi:hypothetical protein
MEDPDQTIHGKEHFRFQARTRLEVRGILKQRTGAERVFASVYVGNAQQYFDAKGHKP